MLIEQAFYNLPEILVGRHYPSQDYESGITGALSLAILQELNGRNVANPIAQMQMEKPFRSKDKAWIGLDDKQRYLRADLHLNLAALKAGSPRLAAYGWRHSNWVEAKFFRAYDEHGKPKKSTNQVVNMGDLIADIVRLLTLVPLEQSKKGTYSGRYLLHVYSGEIGHHLSIKSDNVEREWIKAITQPGPQKLEAFSIASEIDSVTAVLNHALKDLAITMTVFNHVLRPVHKVQGAATFVCVLTRVNQFKVTLGDVHWGIKEDRSEDKSADDAYDTISDFVGARIKTKGGVEDQAPSDKEAEIPQPDEDVADDVDVSEETEVLDGTEA